jgi:hypothetical protein
MTLAPATRKYIMPNLGESQFQTGITVENWKTNYIIFLEFYIFLVKKLAKLYCLIRVLGLSNFTYPWTFAKTVTPTDYLQYIQ